MEDCTLVSILIRTCNRPDILKKALYSVKNQTYKNIEVIVVEDGQNISEGVIKEEFSDLNIKYVSTKQRVGRSKAGNIALALSKGKYINFLDDDDELLPQHIEILLKSFLESERYGAIYSIATEYQIKVVSRYPYKFKIKRKLIRYNEEYHKLTLFHHNYIPIQSIMFLRELYENYGGFDEKLNTLEDWDLWIRYSLYTNFMFVPINTSIYYTPYKNGEKRKRDQLLYLDKKKLLSKLKRYQVNIDVAELNSDLDYIYNQRDKKNLYYWIKKIFIFIMYKDV